MICFCLVGCDKNNDKASEKNRINLLKESLEDIDDNSKNTTLSDSIQTEQGKETGDSTSSDNARPEYGNKKGNLCYGADLQIIKPDGITSETINPIKTGKLTIINFWETWCTPCVNELPYFDLIASEYKNSVAVIAVHTNMVSDTVPGYIGYKGIVIEQNIASGTSVPRGTEISVVISAGKKEPETTTPEPTPEAPTEEPLNVSKGENYD